MLGELYVDELSVNMVWDTCCQHDILEKKSNMFKWRKCKNENL